VRELLGATLTGIVVSLGMIKEILKRILCQAILGGLKSVGKARNLMIFSSKNWGFQQ
jgi:hypothetical protein